MEDSSPIKETMKERIQQMLFKNMDIANQNIERINEKKNKSTESSLKINEIKESSILQNHSTQISELLNMIETIRINYPNFDVFCSYTRCYPTISSTSIISPTILSSIFVGASHPILNGLWKQAERCNYNIPLIIKDIIILWNVLSVSFDSMKIGINDLLNIKEDKETFINFLSNPFSLILGINDNDKETINKRRCIDCTRTQTMEGVALLESGIVSEELEEAVTKIGGSAAMKVVRQAIWMSKQHKYRHILPQLLRLARRCVFAIG